MTPDWTAQSCVPWSPTVTTSSRIISQKTMMQRNNSRSHEQTFAVSTLCKRRKRLVPISPHPFPSYTLAPHQQATEFHFVRDYEVVKVEQEVPNEFLLVFDDGDLTSSIATNGLNDGETRRAGAYYKMIERKMLLKKKRTEVRCRRLSSYCPKDWILFIMRALADRALPRQVGSRACRARTTKPGGGRRARRRTRGGARPNVLDTFSRCRRRG